jgi:hypothetical protein
MEEIARHLKIEGKPVETEEARVHHDGPRTLAYAQPCARFAGLLFYADQSVAWGEASGKVIAAERAQAWSEKLLERFGLRPAAPKGSRFEFALEARETDAVVFDGKERRRVKAKTDVLARIALDGVPVVGPRAKARLVFKDVDRPVMMHLGLWESLGIHEERELVREHDVAMTVRERIADRNRCDDKAYRLCDIRLVYMAGEFAGAPDLLAPEYHVEVEVRDTRHGGENAPIPPRQVVRLPAYR